ncbi:MAG: hypothetical protein NXH95_19335 [Pseudomonadaceae bacterium]|nr:hypothetical protein [Pseudomonadaceae bacterium]
MNDMRSRAKEHFPSVLLTMLSIVQAVALELLWSHLTETQHLVELSWTSVLGWGQVVATFLAIVLIWVVYASNVMRFSRTPVTSDLVYPFFIGLVEFMLIANLAPEAVGIWMLFIALTFGLMFRVSHTSMKQARQDKDNAFFFRDLDPATWKDFYLQFTLVGALISGGVFLIFSGNVSLPALLIVLAVNALLAWQFYVVAHFWERSMVEASD